METHLEIDAFCPHCREHWHGQWSSDWNDSSTPRSKQCETPLFPHATPGFYESAKLDQCPICGQAHLFQQKDFNRKLGISILLVGVVFSYWTYGISLLLVTLLDYWIYRSVGEVCCCYYCESQFRGSIAEVPPFDLELHDYYQNLKRKTPQEGEQ